VADDPTLVQIRERSFLDILDLALVVVREHPITLGLAAVAGALPFALMDAWLIRGERQPALLLIIMILFTSPMATAPLTIVLGGLMFGRKPRAAAVLNTLARSAVPLFLHQCIRVGCALTVVAYVIFPTRLVFMNEVILLEQGPWRSVLRRSLVLTERRGGEFFGRWLASLLIGSLFVLTFWSGTGVLAQALSTSNLTWEPSWEGLAGLRFQATVWLVIEFFAVARFFCYIDQRIRLEGWEVELRLRAVGRALEDVGRW
jgi:hypothetical protein